MGIVNLGALGAASFLLVPFHTPLLDPKIIAANAQTDRGATLYDFVPWHE